MSERITDERLASLFKDAEQCGIFPAVKVNPRELSSVLAELAEFRERVSEALAIERWPYRPSTMAGYELDQAEGYNDARREFRSALGVTDDD